MRSSVLLTPPTDTPVTIDDVKLQLRYTSNDLDAAFSRALSAAIEYCQEYQWAQYCTATYVDRFDRFSQVLEPQRNPVSSVTSVQYVDTSGTTQTLVANTDYTVDTSSKPCRITPAYTKCWPATRGHLNDVTITYVAGYGAANDVPAEIKQAVILKAVQQFEACDSSKMDSVISMLLDKRSFRVFY